jgi:hypothetical protein
MKRRTPPICPVCGEDVPPRALACPECGACHETGWREDSTAYDGLDLPDEAWQEESGGDVRPQPRRRDSSGGISRFWRVVAVVVLLAMFWFLWQWILAVGRARWW